MYYMHSHGATLFRHSGAGGGGAWQSYPEAEGAFEYLLLLQDGISD